MKWMFREDKLSNELVALQKIHRVDAVENWARNNEFDGEKLDQLEWLTAAQSFIRQNSVEQILAVKIQSSEAA